MRLIVPGVLAAFLVACGQDQSITFPEESRAPGILSSLEFIGSDCSNSSTPSLGYLQEFWTCDEIIRLEVDGTSAWPSGMEANVQSATSAAALQWLTPLKVANTDMPRLVYNGSATHGHTISVYWDATGVGTDVCGTVTAAGGGGISPSNVPRYIKLYYCSGQGDLNVLMTHELSHAYGYVTGGGTNNSHNIDVGTEYGESCARRLISAGIPSSGPVCQWEIEQLFYLYRVRPDSVTPNRALVNAVTVAPDTAWKVGDTASVAVVSVATIGEDTDGPSAFNYSWSRSGNAVTIIGNPSGHTATLVGANHGISNVVALPTGPSTNNDIATFITVNEAVMSLTLKSPLGFSSGWCNISHGQGTYIVSVPTDLLASDEGWEATETTSDTPPGASPTIFRSGGKADTSTTMGPYTQVPPPGVPGVDLRYWWVRKVFANDTKGDWVASVNNPYGVDRCNVF